MSDVKYFLLKNYKYLKSVDQYELYCIATFSDVNKFKAC